MNNANGRTLAGVISELKEEVKEFLETRYQMLVSELQQKLATWRMAMPLFLVALALGAIGFLLLSGALVAAIALLVGWGWSFLIVGAVYLVLGGSIGFLAYREIKEVGVAPTRTINVLKQDQVWLQSEARSQL
ncbi:MAG TPA: phage holin family protein [Terriglobales bacterium]|nr:phage holin family protein [Terriglobales bacterium]